MSGACPIAQAPDRQVGHAHPTIAHAEGRPRVASRFAAANAPPQRAEGEYGHSVVLKKCNQKRDEEQLCCNVDVLSLEPAKLPRVCV